MPSGAAKLGFWFINNSPPLPPPVVDQFINPGFEQGAYGYTIITSYINWDGGSTLAGFPTPALPDPYLYGSSGPATTVVTPGYNNYTLNQTDVPVAGQKQSMSLNQGFYGTAQVDPLGASLWGPALYTNYFVTFNAGDTCAFDWRAVSDEDAYSVYVYLVEKDTGAVISLLRSASPNEYFDSSWATNTTVVPTTGNYKFVFVCGTWDSTFGSLLSGRMLIDNLRRIV